MHISRSLNARIRGSSFHLDCFLQSETLLWGGRHNHLTVTDGHRYSILPLEATTVILLPPDSRSDNGVTVEQQQFNFELFVLSLGLTWNSLSFCFQFRFWTTLDSVRISKWADSQFGFWTTFYSVQISKWADSQFGFWTTLDSVRIGTNQSKWLVQWEFSKRIRLLKLEVRSFVRGYAVKLKIIRTYNSRCHTNDRFVLYRIMYNERYDRRLFFEQIKSHI